MEKENAIIIDGVKHTLVKSKNYATTDCLQCSLYDLCESNICEILFDTAKGNHFEILKQE